MRHIIRMLGLGAALFILGCAARVEIDAKRQAAADEALAQRRAAEKAELAQRHADLLDAGKKALEVKRFDAAIESFELAISLEDIPEARALLRKAQDARDEFRKQAFDDAMRRGEKTFNEKNYSAAIAGFRDALGNIPGDKKAIAALQYAEFHDFLERGRVSLKNEKFADAVKAFEQAVTRQPDDQGARGLLQQARKERRRQVMTQGKQALNTKNYPEAVQCFTEAKDLLPDAEAIDFLRESSFQKSLQLGQQRVEARQFSAAISDLEDAIRLKADDAPARALLQKAKEGKRQQDRADYERAMAAGDSAMAAKNYQAGINAYREALAKQAQDTTASTKLGQAQNAKTTQDKKGSFDRHMSAGKTQMSFKNYRSAETEFQAALADMPGDAQARNALHEAQRLRSKKESFDRHMSMGNLHMSSKNFSAAASEFQSALFDLPGDLQAQSALQKARQSKR